MEVEGRESEIEMKSFSRFFPSPTDPEPTVHAMIALSLALGSLAFCAVLVSFNRKLRSPSRSKSVGLIVLGDIGRSPRMLYHAQSFTKNGYTTYIVAFRGSNPPRALLESKHCHFIYLSQPLPWTSKLPRIAFLVFAPVKVLLGAASLLYALLFRIPLAPSFFFVQNPPSIPTLPIVQLAALLRRSKLVIDWHNTGYSVLSLRLGSDHPVVRIAKKIEFMFGSNAFAHLMVTETMKLQLVEEARLKGKALAFHDRPPRHFRRQSLAESHKLFLRLPELRAITFPSSAAEPLHSLADEARSSSTTTFTTTSPLLNISLKPNRPALLVTSTSHTPDEDLSILLRALESYHETAASQARQKAEEDGKGAKVLPKVVLLVTGKGGGKAAFEREIAALSSKSDFSSWVQISTAWLELEDYPKLLGASDLGISLHSSTSGFDLPMKVVDMFGCELPVLALDFPAIGELVQDGVNGRTFKDETELAHQLVELLAGFGSQSDLETELDRLRRGIRTTTYGTAATALDDTTRKALVKRESERGTKWSDWEAHWDELILPLLSKS